VGTKIPVEGRGDVTRGGGMGAQMPGNCTPKGSLLGGKLGREGAADNLLGSQRSYGKEGKGRKAKRRVAFNEGGRRYLKPRHRIG